MSVTAGVSDYYGRLSRQFPSFLRDEARHVGELTTREVASRTPVGRRVDQNTGADLGPSGRARRSWKPIPPRRIADGYESGASSGVAYVPELENGAPAHIIPQGGRAAGVWLRFWSHGELRFAREVHHPGMRGHFMMERGLREAERRYQSEADRRLQDFLDERSR